MRGRGFRLWLGLAAVVAAAGLAVPAASAGTFTGTLLPSCGSETYPFAPWEDPDSYCAYPNVGFESGTTAWTLTGSTSIVAANEPWYVSGFGTHALRLGPGAAALSSPLPISIIDPWIRFFAQTADANGPLSVRVLFHGLTGNLTGVANFGSLAPGDFATWEPTDRVLSALALPVGTSSAQVLLVSQATQGSWQVDDVYLDPCVSRVG